MNPSDAAYAGQEIYSRAFLRIYDPVILGVYRNIVWRCPTSRLVEQYPQHAATAVWTSGPVLPTSRDSFMILGLE